jgi:hypothetical protein
MLVAIHLRWMVEMDHRLVAENPIVGHRMLVYPRQKNEAWSHRLDAENLTLGHRMLVYPRQKSVALIRTLVLENLIEAPRHRTLGVILNCLRWMVEMNRTLDVILTMNHRPHVGPNHKTVYPRQKSVALIRTLVLENPIEAPRHRTLDVILTMNHRLVAENPIVEHRMLDAETHHRLVYPRQKNAA